MVILSIMSELEQKKPGLPARLTPMQRKFAELLVFNEGHKFAYGIWEAGYERTMQHCKKTSNYKTQNTILL